MFDFVRKHTKIMQFLLFLLIFPSFVLFGLEGYSRFNEKGEAVASVDGHNITQAEWDAAHKQESERMRQSMPNVDAKLLDSPEVKFSTLEGLVQDRVLQVALASQRLSVSEQRLATELTQNRAVAALRGADGKLDMARYRQMLAQQGMSPEMFEARVRDDLSVAQVVGGVVGPGITSGAQAALTLEALFQQREIQVARWLSTDYLKQVSLSDADVEAFYKANPKQFEAPEAATIEYVVLDLEAMRKSVTVAEADLKTYFDQNVSRLAGKEERRASHILIAVGKDASPELKAKAKAKAEELAAAVRKSPDQLPTLAKKHSQDPGSAANGGDLDFFSRGAMTKPFEDAVFGGKKGDIIGPVETDFGYHVIRVTDLRQPKQRTFEEMRPELENELRKQQAQKKYAESAEAFTNGVYEQSDSLKPVADKLKLEVRTASGVTRTPALGAAGPLSNPKFLSALFSSDSIEKKRNTEAVEVGANQLISARITQYQAARTLPLDEVRNKVRERLQAERAAELARKEGQAKRDAWQKDPASAAVSAPSLVSRQNPNNQPQQLVEAALKADPTRLPGIVGVDLGNLGYAVIRVNRVLPRETPPPQVSAQERARYNQAWGNAEGMAYFETLKERYKAKILVAKPGALGASAAAPASAAK